MSEIEVQQENEVDLLILFSIMIRNVKWLVTITFIFIICAISISIVSKKLPPSRSFLPDLYSPKSLVLLNSNSSSNVNSILNDPGVGALASLAGLSSDSYGPKDSDLAIKLAKTNAFIEKLNDEFSLGSIYGTNNDEYPKTSLKNEINKKLKISLDEASGILEITYTDIDKLLATKIVNKVTQLLEDEFAKIDLIRNKSQLSLVENKKTQVELVLIQLSAELISFQKKHNLVDVDTVYEELIRQMSLMQDSLLKKEIELQSYGIVTNIKDPGYKRLLNEKTAILNAINKLNNGEVGNYPPIKDFPKLALELGKIKSEIDIQETVYKTLIQQYETLKLTAEGTGPTFQVLEKAEIPEMKSGPSRGKLCIILAFVGFFFSLLIVFLKEVFFNIKNDPEKMKRLRGEK